MESEVQMVLLYITDIYHTYLHKYIHTYINKYMHVYVHMIVHTIYARQE